MTVANPFAAWMDRLSDGLGAWIPGCGRLSARHPVKVSLVMGLLGGLCGWAAVVLGLAMLTLTTPGNHFEMVHRASGFLYGGFILLPWAVWSGRRVVTSIWLIAYGWGLYFATVAIVERTGRVELYGGMLGLGVTSIALMLGPRPRWWPVWLLMAVVVSASAAYLIYLMVEYDDFRLSIERFVGSDLSDLIRVGWFLSTLHAATAIWLGTLLWDHRVRLVLELVPGEEQVPK